MARCSAMWKVTRWPSTSLRAYLRDLRLYRLVHEAAARLIDAAGIDTFQALVPSPGCAIPPTTATWCCSPPPSTALTRCSFSPSSARKACLRASPRPYAAAQGLMQIILDTGQWIALQLGWRDYQNSDVYRPYVNVAFAAPITCATSWPARGCSHAALAGYNGGPGNAAQWLSISVPDLDLLCRPSASTRRAPTCGASTSSTTSTARCMG